MNYLLQGGYKLLDAKFVINMFMISYALFHSLFLSFLMNVLYAEICFGCCRFPVFEITNAIGNEM